VARGVTEKDFAGTSASFVKGPNVVDLIAKVDKVVTF
jgi:hypothetical protein